MADRGDNRAQHSDRLPVLSFLGRPGPDASPGTGGFLSAAIAGSLILVLALMGNLDDQNAVLGDEPDQRDEADLRVEVVRAAPQPQRGEREDQRGDGVPGGLRAIARDGRPAAGVHARCLAKVTAR